MASPTRNVDLGLTGCVLVALGGWGGCAYLGIAKIATPWFWVILAAAVPAFAALVPLGIRRNKIIPSRTEWSPKRQKNLALSQLLVFYGVTANLASSYSGQTLGAEWASGILLGVAGGFLIGGFVALHRALRGPRERDESAP